MTRTRFAPSPTGFLHIGSLRTALYAYALAKHKHGEFLLRVEDTDQKREVAGSTEALQTTLKKFNLQWDEYYLQSDRAKSGIYRQAAVGLVDSGHAFYCQCLPKNAKAEGYSLELRDPCRDKGLTSGAIKLKVPLGQTVSYHDFVHKKDISWATDSVYDATLLKSDGWPTYHLAAMVDDLDMHITHILRGHDWLPSTPIHLLVFQFLGGDQPEMGHLTDILSDATGKKLSKRRDSVFAEQFLTDGYLPEALLNFIMLLGWAPKDNRELFTLDEFVEHFDISGFQEANPRFVDKKLKWFNGYYLRSKSDSELLTLLRPFLTYEASDDLLLKIIPLVKERITTLKDFSPLTEFFVNAPRSAGTALNSDHLALAREILAAADWTKEGIETPLLAAVKVKGWKTGDFFMTLRLAICGSRVTPPLTESMLILGKNETLTRIDLSLDARR